MALESPDFHQLSHSALLDAAPDAMIIVSESAEIVLVNLQAEKLFGYSRNELVGQSLEIVIPDASRGLHKQHLARFFAGPKTRTMGSGLELYGRHRDGTLIPVEVSLSPLRTPEGMFVSSAIRDVTERRRMEAAVKLTADRLSAAVESVQDAFVLFDGEGKLFLCNSVYRALLGVALHGPAHGRAYEEILEAWMDTLVFADDAERARFRADRLARRGQARVTFDVRTKDGKSLRVMDHRTPDGGLVETIWDLTDDVRREEELREARAAADVASAAKSEFLSSMSHELRTPLNAILGFAQLLQRDKREALSSRHQERIVQILKGGEHLLHLIDDILDLSRVEAGGVSISTEPVGVEEVLREVKTTLDPAAARAGITLALDAIEGHPAIVADRTRFAQILMNFGSNAIKYNRAGGSVRFRVERKEPTHIRVTVLDTGTGIPHDKQDKLFQPFQRAGQETGPIEGTGIGLAISRRLAELMHGSVGFQSRPSQGSEFWVEMPEHTLPEPASIIPPHEHIHALLDGERRGLVLYVEDNPANVVFMRDLLGAFEGIELVVAPTGETGIELARKLAPKAVIMDINLPGISGIEALGILRESPETSEIPVIALTAAASERDRKRGELAGFYRYLTKPVKVDELEAALEAILAHD
ncbi:MAG TPA: PAS domain S-box protein [Polyangiaceae bacterium]|jgi:PAS domain S-box-containing protein|nr:PAS domain S-box protein [Polyangiaceae bacterium]